jgi:hypothetical protein
LIDVPTTPLAQKALAMVEDYEVRLMEMRRQRDLWESMHRNQCAVNEPMHKLVADQREFIERLRVQVNQFERLLGMIPCTGDFDKACQWVTSVTAKGAGARPLVPDGTNRTHGSASAQPPGAESPCVAEVIHGTNQAMLWCQNCNETVCEGAMEPGQHPEAWGAEQAMAWENHVKSKRGTGTDGQGRTQTTAPQFPHGRFASAEKGGV